MLFVFFMVDWFVSFYPFVYFLYTCWQCEGGGEKLAVVKTHSRELEREEIIEHSN